MTTVREIPIRTAPKITGHLGRPPHFAETRTRVIEPRHHPAALLFEHAGQRFPQPHEVREEAVPYDALQPDEPALLLTATPRTFARLSIAEHTPGGTQWHRIVAWDADKRHYGLRRLATGDLVEVTVYPDSFETADGETIEQFVLIDYRVLRKAAVRDGGRRRP